jgi:hypothetical protein
MVNSLNIVSSATELMYSRQHYRHSSMHSPFFRTIWKPSMSSVILHSTHLWPYDLISRTPPPPIALPRWTSWYPPTPKKTNQRALHLVFFCIVYFTFPVSQFPVGSWCHLRQSNTPLRCPTLSTACSGYSVEQLSAYHAAKHSDSRNSIRHSQAFCILHFTYLGHRFIVVPSFVIDKYRSYRKYCLLVDATDSVII